MSDLPENVTLEWLGRNILDLRRDVRSLKDDMSVVVAIMTRLNNAQSNHHSEMQALFDLHRELRKRVEKVEDAQ